MRMNPKATKWAHLTAFQKQAVIATLRRGGKPDANDDDRPYGLAIKRELEVIRGEEVNHGRLYPNLDDLVDDGLLRKGERDRRTNTYTATDEACEAFAAFLSEYVGLDVDVDDVTHDPAAALDKQTSKASNL